jgi:tripeptide aminopeptidase
MNASVPALTTATFEELAGEREGLARIAGETLDVQMEITRIAAPTGQEQRRGSWIADRFAEIGIPVEMDGAGNVIARTAGIRTTAPVVVCAHLDTVLTPDPRLDVRRDGTRLVGPGICDNSRGLAAMLAVARVIQRCADSLSRPVEFVATTGEEGAGDLRGAKHYFANAPHPFAVVALDGAGDERIVNTALGSRRYRVTYRGPGGHSWAAYGTANPVHAVARAATHLAALKVLDDSSRTAISVSRIGGGVAINAIPEDAWLEVEVRSTSDVTLHRYDRQIRHVVESAAAEENQRRAPGSAAMTFAVDRIGERPSGQTRADEALVLAAMEATRLIGRVPELATASTDANAAIAIGAPAIAIGGGGRGGDAHSSREWFDDRGATAGVERALTIVATMARLAADQPSVV